MKMLRALFCVVVIGAAAATDATAQTARCDAANTWCTQIARLMQRADVTRALQFAEQQNTIARTELIALTQIPAPPFAEEKRAAAFAQMLREAGADSVYTDS